MTFTVTVFKEGAIVTFKIEAPNAKVAYEEAIEKGTLIYGEVPKSIRVNEE
jgi:hypothetical protein